MSNVLKFSELIGIEDTVHEFEIGGRTVLYTDPTLESIPALNKMLGGDWTFTTIYDTALKTLRGQRFKDGEPFTEAWLKSVPFGEFTHFTQFIRNPGNPGPKPKNAEPLIAEGLRGFDVVLPPITLGDLKFFGEYLAGNSDAPLAEYLLEQLGAAFDRATLKDGSPLPENLLSGLTLSEAQRLIAAWINGQAEPEVKTVKKASGTGRKRKASTGKRSAPSSPKSSASAPSETTPTTSAD